MITTEGGEASSFQADVTSADDCHAMVRTCVDRLGRLDILHNSVGIATGDAGAVELDEAAWDRIVDTNLKAMFLACKYALPIMREQGSGCIVNVSSIASIAAVPMLAYKVSKAGVNALTQQIPMSNAKHGIRANAILPGLMNTPMAIESWAGTLGVAREEIVRRRDAQVPLGGKQGTAWDVAHAALFLASDEAKFITGVLLPVDGRQTLRIG